MAQLFDAARPGVNPERIPTIARSDLKLRNPPRSSFRAQHFERGALEDRTAGRQPDHYGQC
jgi:hypothetical protein